MPKAGEITYLQKLGPDGLAHALDKPFSDADCGTYLIVLGAIRKLLPPPPARLLDLGCGTGWTTCLFARMGYDVVGQDIAPDMIALAEQNKQRYEADTASFHIGDYESLPFREEFDAAVFFDSLHHAEDEWQAMAGVYRALKSGGVCVTREPGAGHVQSEDCRMAVRKYGVTEKDMPAEHISAVARDVGFRTAFVCPSPDRLFEGILRYLPGKGGPPTLYERLTCAPARRHRRQLRNNPLVVLIK